MSAAGKKNKLKMKYPMKLWPFRPATRAGQNVDEVGRHEDFRSEQPQPWPWPS